MLAKYYKIFCLKKLLFDFSMKYNSYKYYYIFFLFYILILLFFSYSLTEFEPTFSMKNAILNKKIPAFNLQETLIVLAIIGILLLLALPNLMPLITKAKSLEAQTQLKALYNAQTTYNYMYSKFTADFNELDFFPPKTVKENGTANYRYEIISATNTTFKARAEAVTDFDGDGILNVWEIDENGNPKQTVKD